MTSMVKYGSYELDAAEQEEKDNQRTGADFMKLEVGDNQVRILPPPIGGKSPFLIVPTHFIHPPGSSKPVMFACPNKVASQRCPACEMSDKLRRSANPADHERAKDFFANRRIYCAVINRANPEVGPLVLGISKGVHEDLIKLRKNPDWGGDFTHPEVGFDIVINRKGSGKKDTKYSVSPKRQSPLGYLGWLETLPNLNALAAVMSYEQIMSKLSGQADAPAKSGGAGGGKVVDADGYSPPDMVDEDVPF